MVVPLSSRLRTVSRRKKENNKLKTEYFVFYLVLLDIKRPRVSRTFVHENIKYVQLPYSHYNNRTILMLHIVMQIRGCVCLSPGSWVVLHVVMLAISDGAVINSGSGSAIHDHYGAFICGFVPSLMVVLCLMLNYRPSCSGLNWLGPRALGEFMLIQILLMHEAFDYELLQIASFS